MQKLVDLKVVSTPEITFFTLPFDVLLSNYITTIENFIYEDSDSINTKIATVVTKRLGNAPNITALIHNHQPFQTQRPTPRHTTPSMSSSSVLNNPAPALSGTCTFVTPPS